MQNKILIHTIYKIIIYIIYIYIYEIPPVLCLAIGYQNYVSEWKIIGKIKNVLNCIALKIGSWRRVTVESYHRNFFVGQEIQFLLM